jgi:hypothetical protein
MLYAMPRVKVAHRIRISNSLIESYALHLKQIEALLVIGFTIASSILILLTVIKNSDFLLYAYFLWFVGLPIAFSIHGVMYKSIGSFLAFSNVSKEIHRTHELANLYSITRYRPTFILVSILIYGFSFLISFFHIITWETAPYYVFDVCLYVPSTVLIIISLFFSIFSLSRFQVSRILFTLVSSPIEKLETDREPKAQRKNSQIFLNLFFRGLNDYNSHLYKKEKIQIKTKTIRNGTKRAFGTCMLSDKCGLEKLSNQIQECLSCMREEPNRDEIKHFLTSLRNIQTAKNKRAYPDDELVGMIQVQTSSFQQVREILKSASFAGSIALIALILQLLPFFMH